MCMMVQLLESLLVLTKDIAIINFLLTTCISNLVSVQYNI